MRPLTVLSVAALLVGGALGLGELAAPTCRNYAGTARDSGYPCRVDRSSGDTDYVLSRTRTVSVPHGDTLAVVLLVGGGIGMGMSRRR